MLRLMRLMRGGMNGGWGQTIWISPPPAERRQLAAEKRSCRVKEVRSLPSWQECGHYHAKAMGIKLSYFCNVQLPAGDKHCLAEPVNPPASLGTCPHHINWCKHLQHRCLILTQQKYCCRDKWIARIWFRVKLNYCTVRAMHMKRLWAPTSRILIQEKNRVSKIAWAHTVFGVIKIQHNLRGFFLLLWENTRHVYLLRHKYDRSQVGRLCTLRCTCRNRITEEEEKRESVFLGVRNLFRDFTSAQADKIYPW